LPFHLDSRDAPALARGSIAELRMEIHAAPFAHQPRRRRRLAFHSGMASYGCTRLALDHLRSADWRPLRLARTRIGRRQKIDFANVPLGRLTECNLPLPLLPRSRSWPRLPP